MSTINYMDLIKNPEKHGIGRNQPQTQRGNNETLQPRQGVLPKEAVIPSNLNGAQKNEWQEKRQQQQQQDSRIKNSNQKINNEKRPQQVESPKKNNSYRDGAAAPAALNLEAKKQSLLKQSQESNSSKNRDGGDGVSRRQVGNQQNDQINKAEDAAISKQERLRAQYSLKEESKQDYKRIFQSVVKEYRDDENYFFDANQTRYSTYFLCFLVVLLSSMVYFDYQAKYTPKFCLPGMNDNATCLKCPENAECKHYVMRCHEGFIQQSNYTCVMNPKLITSAENFIIEKLTGMQEENGNHICFREDDNQEGVDDKLLLTGDSALKASSSISLDSLLNELELRIQDQKLFEPQKKILTTFIESEKNQHSFKFSFDTSSKQLTTSRVKFSLFCKGKVLVIQNKRACQAIGIAAFMLSVFTMIVMKRWRQEAVAKKIYEELENEIQNSADKLINVSYYKEGIVNRYKTEFNERIWMLVDQRRFNQKKINVFRDYDGLYWSQA